MVSLDQRRATLAEGDHGGGLADIEPICVFVNYSTPLSGTPGVLGSNGPGTTEKTALEDWHRHYPSTRNTLVTFTTTGFFSNAATVSRPLASGARCV